MYACDVFEPVSDKVEPRNLSCGPSTDSEICEISSESSRESSETPVPNDAKRDRKDQQHRKYHQVFGDAHVPRTAWERLANGEIACHVSQLVFATAVQCINHKKTRQYSADLAASELGQDEDMLAELETQAQAEKDRLHSQKHAIVKQKNMAKQNLRIETARLARLVRQSEHELLCMNRKIEKMQTQHDRRMEHMKSTYQRKIDKLLRKLESKEGRGQDVQTRTVTTQTVTTDPETPQVSTPPPKLDAEVAAPRPGTCEAREDPWVPVQFDVMAGLQRMSFATIKGQPAPEPAPEAVLQAFCNFRACMVTESCLATHVQDRIGSECGW